MKLTIVAFVFAAALSIALVRPAVAAQTKADGLNAATKVVPLAKDTVQAKPDKPKKSKKEDGGDGDQGGGNGRPAPDTGDTKTTDTKAPNSNG